jgi:hypothetical protein
MGSRSPTRAALSPDARASRAVDAAQRGGGIRGRALLVLLAGPLFARYAAGLERLTGLEASFVGTWLVGSSTSLPELVTATRST